MTKSNFIGQIIHIVCVLILFVSMCLFIEKDADGFEMNWMLFRRQGLILLFFAIVFYINYFILIPRLYFSGNRVKFFLIDLLLIFVVAIGLQFVQHYDHSKIVFDRHEIDSFLFSENELAPMSLSEQDIPSDFPPPPPPLHAKSILSVHFILCVRDILLLSLAVALSLALRLVLQVREIEAQKNEYERAKFEAELANMRSQVNPHFLLNTLNNIYSLIQFDSEKAQTAVLELSKLLRYVLYEDKTELVPLQTVIDFLKHYIYLMKIRLTDGVKVDVDMSCDFDTLVPPLLSVSLVENAFKHGVSPEGDGELSFHLHDEEDGRVLMQVINTNYPKTKQDRSGSGIGLKLLKRRLNMMYPGKYEFSSYVTEDNKYYISNLIINTDNHDN